MQFVYSQRLRASSSSSASISIDSSDGALKLSLTATSSGVIEVFSSGVIDDVFLTAKVNAVAQLTFSTDEESLVVSARTSGQISLRSLSRLRAQGYATSNGNASIVVEPELTLFIGWGIPI